MTAGVTLRPSGLQRLFERNLPGRDGLPVAGVERAVGRVVQRVTGSALLVTAGVAIVAPRSNNIVYTGAGLVAALAVLAAGGALLVLAYRRGPAIVRRAVAQAERFGWWLAVPLAVAGGLLSVWIGRHLAYTYGWDAGVVQRAALDLTRPGGWSKYDVSYFSHYPNNLILLALDNQSLPTVPGSLRLSPRFVTLNGACVGATLLLTFALGARLRSRLAGLVAEALAFVLVALTPWSAVPYTDLPAMPFVAAGVLAGVAALQRRRAAAMVSLLLLSGGLLGVAYVVKTTPASSVVALALVVLVLAMRRPSLRACACLLAAVGAIGVGFASGSAAATAWTDAHLGVSRSSFDVRYSPPPSWWIAMGLTTRFYDDGHPMYGVYNSGIVHASRSLHRPELTAWSNQLLRSTLARETPGSLAAFEWNKQVYNWGDGMFYAWGEGPDAAGKNILDHSKTGEAVRAFEHPLGAYYSVRAHLATAMWLAVLGCAGIALILAGYRRDLLFLALAFAGIAAFVLVFQGRSRYVFPYVPVLVGLAVACGPPRIADLRSRARHWAGAPGKPS